MMSNTIEGARSMVQTMRETGKLLQIGHQRRKQSALYVRAQATGAGRKNLRPAHRRQRAMEPGGHRRPGLAQKIHHVARGAGEIWLQGHAPVPELALVQGPWRGPLSDLGAHQIDIFNWWFGVTPSSVMASGGVDYYKNHEWYDNAMVVYEYPLPTGMARAFYEVLTTTSAGGGYFEMFMGDEGTIKMSENPSITKLYRRIARRSGMNWWRKTICVPAPPWFQPEMRTRWMCGKPRRCCNTTSRSRSIKKSTSRIWRIFSTPSAAPPS